MVKDWDTNIRCREVAVVIPLSKEFLLTLNYLITKVGGVYEMSSILEMSA